MGLLITTILVSTFTFSIFAQTEIKEWENPQIFDKNKEKAHATLMPFRTVEEALSLKPQQSVFYKTLSGTWKFNWVRKPAARPLEFYKPDFDVSEKSNKQRIGH
jgi:beta-galactosidase